MGVEGSAKIAIVGAGPAGCYTAQALLKLAPALEVDVIDAQPTPFGLLRYGVAADHQGTKAVARQFTRVFTRQNARFFGNLRIGAAVSLADLQKAYDAVVLAAGLSVDRLLGIPGEDHPKITGSGALTRALYDHPEAGPLPELGQAPLIIGTGNVAIDILRLLAKTPDELAGSDLGPKASDWLAAQRFRKITVIGRSCAAAARFDDAMLKELAAVSQIDLRVAHMGPAKDEAGGARIATLRAAVEGTSGPLEIAFRFQSRPLAVEDHLGELMLSLETPAGVEQLSATSILTAIGFASDGRLSVRREASAPYAIGWFRDGPIGAIPRCRIEAQSLAKQILSELKPDPGRIGSALFRDLPDVVDFDHWQRIDAVELALATKDRCRQKLSSRADLLNPPLLRTIET